ncbi:MAG: SDR family oxidoreductase [Planctomycetaceae bacterium]|nr:SDR family oxidoreductase [Planctomycetaceae bacterium]
MDIKGKTVIITGSTGKLARTIVLSLAQAGVNCICVYHKNKKAANALESAIKKNGARSLSLAADLTKPQDVEKIFTKIKKFSQPEILINAAAVFEKMPSEKITGDYVRKIFDLNFTSAMVMTQKFAALLKKNKKAGKIINITDATIEKHPKEYSVYTASKAALESATISLAKELAPNITVNAVAPGVVHWQKGVTVEQKKGILSRIPAGREGLAEEVAAAVKFLIENDYITGQTITVDGGWTL